MLHPGHPAVAYDVTPSGHNIVGLARFRHGIVVASYDGGGIIELHNPELLVKGQDEITAYFEQMDNELNK